MTLVYPRSGTVFEFKGQRATSQGQNLARTTMHRHSLGAVTSHLRFCGCLVCVLLTLARWHNQPLTSRRRGFEIGIECLLV